MFRYMFKNLFSNGIWVMLGIVLWKFIIFKFDYFEKLFFILKICKMKYM